MFYDRYAFSEFVSIKSSWGEGGCFWALLALTSVALSISLQGRGDSGMWQLSLMTRECPLLCADILGGSTDARHADRGALLPLADLAPNKLLSEVLLSPHLSLSLSHSCTQNAADFHRVLTRHDVNVPVTSNLFLTLKAKLLCDATYSQPIRWYLMFSVQLCEEGLWAIEI